MPSTLSALHRVTHSAEFQHLPVRIVADNETVPWWEALNCMAEAAARHTVCLAAHNIALLFDTYGEHIEKVELCFSVFSEDDAEGLLDVSLLINSQHFYNGSANALDDAAERGVEAVDGRQVFDAVVADLDDLGNAHLIPQAGLLRRAFSEPLVSAEAARTLARAYAPEADAWLRNRLLEQGLAGSGERRPAPRM